MVSHTGWLVTKSLWINCSFRAAHTFSTFLHKWNIKLREKEYERKQILSIISNSLISTSLFWIEKNSLAIITDINPFHVNVLFLYLMKTSENLSFSDFFRGYRNRTLAWKGLMCYKIKEMKRYFVEIYPINKTYGTMTFYIKHHENLSFFIWFVFSM